jgi:O-antigen ligase
MNEKIPKLGLRVRSNTVDGLDMLLVTVIALLAFVPYIMSGALLVVVWISILSIKRTLKAVFKQKSMLLLTLGISTLSLVSSVIASNLIGALISIGVFAILTLGAYLMQVMNKALFERALLVIAIGSIPTAIITVIQQIVIEYEEYRPSAHAFNPNYLGAIATLSAVIMLVFVLEKGIDAKLRVLYGAAFLSSCVTILVTESRSSLLALMACIVAYVFLKKKYVLCALAVVGGASLWAIGWFKPELFSWSNSLIEVFTVRYEIWQDTFKSFSQNLYTALIGRGPMSYFHVYETEGLGAHHHAHNIFLDTLINVGIVGFLMYAAIILLFVKRVFANRKRGDTAAFIVSALVIVEVIVQGIPDVTIMWHQTAPLFLIGCAATLKNN